MPKKKEILIDDGESPKSLSSKRLKLSCTIPAYVAVKKEDKYLVSIDNLRLVCYALPKFNAKGKTNPDFTEDSFEVTNWYTTGLLGAYSQMVLGQIQVNPVVELKFGSYKKDLIHTRN